jgi:hypothetical protein
VPEWDHEDDAETDLDTDLEQDLHELSCEEEIRYWDALNPYGADEYNGSRFSD